MSSEIEWGRYEIAKAPPEDLGALADAEYDRTKLASNLSARWNTLEAAFDERNDAIEKATGVKFFHPLRSPPTSEDYLAMGQDAKGKGAVFQYEWMSNKYLRDLKALAEKHPEHAAIIRADESPVLVAQKRAMEALQKSGDMAEKAGLLDRKSFGNIPVISDAAALVRNLAVHPQYTAATFWGGFKAQMTDPGEAALNLLPFGATSRAFSLIKNAGINAGANAVTEAAVQPARQINQQAMNLPYGWDDAIANIGGAATAGALLDLGIRVPGRAALKTFGRDTPAGTWFSKEGRGGFALDAIEPVEPIKAPKREAITADEMKLAEAGDIKAMESIATKTGVIEDPAIKGLIDHAKYVGPIDEAMAKRFRDMGIDHGEGMALLAEAIRGGYARTPDPIPTAKSDLDLETGATLASKIADIEQKFAEAPEMVRQTLRQGLGAGLPEYVKTAQAALSGDVGAIARAIDEAGGPQAMADRATVHSSTNPVAVADAIRRTPGVVDSSVSLETDFMRGARALAALDQPAFDMVVRGEAPHQIGALVANSVPPGLHGAVLQRLKDAPSVHEARQALPDLIPDEAIPAKADGISDPAGPEAKAQSEALAKAHPSRVDDLIAEKQKWESQIETLRGEIAKGIPEEKAKAAPDEALLSPEDKLLIDTLLGRLGIASLDDLALLRAEGQSFGSMIDAVLDRVSAEPNAKLDALHEKRVELRKAEQNFDAIEAEQAALAKNTELFKIIIERSVFRRSLDVRRAVDDALRLGDRILPESTKLDLRHEEMRDPTTGLLVDAVSDSATGDVILAAYAVDPAGRIGHEGVHTLVTKGHLSPAEVDLLAKAAREKGLFKNEADYRETYSDREAYSARADLDRILNEEAAAHAVEARINGEDFGPQNTMLDRVAQLFERIRNALAGYGFQTADDVIGAIYRGDVARRVAREDWARSAVADGKKAMRETAEQGVALPDGTRVNGVPLFALRAYRGGREVSEPENMWFWQKPQKSGTALMYHATNRSFDKFDPNMSNDFGIHFGTASQAEQRLKDTKRFSQGRTIPVEVTVKNAITMKDPGFWGPTEIAEAIQKQGYQLTEGEWDEFVRLSDAIDEASDTLDRVGKSATPMLKKAVNEANAAIKAKLNEIGVDGIWYRNLAEGKGWSLTVWNEGQVRSAMTGNLLYALRDEPSHLDTETAIADRMGTLKDLIEACAA